MSLGTCHLLPVSHHLNNVGRTLVVDGRETSGGLCGRRRNAGNCQQSDDRGIGSGGVYVVPMRYAVVRPRDGLHDRRDTGRCNGWEMAGARRTVRARRDLRAYHRAIGSHARRFDHQGWCDRWCRHASLGRKDSDRRKIKKPQSSTKYKAKKITILLQAYPRPRRRRVAAAAARRPRQ